MADEEVKPEEMYDYNSKAQVEAVPLETEPAQEELPLATASEETAEADKPAEATAEPEPVKEEPKPDWKEKELKAKHRKNQELKREKAELQAKLDAQAALLAKFNQGGTEQPTTVPVDEIDKRAKELVAQERYVENCNKTAAEGEKSYGESWKEAVSNLEILGGFDAGTMYGVLATDSPAKVLYELGKNPDRYYQIMQMPLERRIIEMGKIAMAPASKPVSEAPAPVNPVGGRAAPAKETIRDDMDDDKWYAVRLAQKRAKWNAGQVRR